MDKFNNKLWLWGHHTGSHNGSYGIPEGASNIFPADAAQYMGISNMLMVVYRDQPEPPFEPYCEKLASLKNIVWSTIGNISSSRNDNASDLDSVLSLASKFPNINGAVMDDFFNPLIKGGSARISFEKLISDHQRLSEANLDLWVVLYGHQLDLPVKKYLKHCDVINFWTWDPYDLENLEKNLDKVNKLAPGKRISLGCYMYDYNKKCPIPLDLMKYQCDLALKWLSEDRIDSIVLLASCICDIDLEAVEWTREWIRNGH